ncbi:hypothetical protein Cgig2_011976 [Carnegiea gigantea]|uniref:Uncharacterized protein n=1 Tax=Carnegiea gigantea TaxID=171969 RepID=A0A9Q1GJ39_9CARY|nr:hypothetical protein Cgig2_011976 [Carnegiea gigantea]
MTFGSGKKLPGPSYGSEGVRAPRNSVNAPSEDELLSELSEEKLKEASPKEELVLVEATSAPGFDKLIRKLDVGDRLGLHHSSNLEISHIISYGDLLGICHLHLWTKDTRDGGWHRIGNLMGLPTLILSGDTRHCPAINKGRKAKELQMVALHLGTDQPLRNILTGCARR